MKRSDPRRRSPLFAALVLSVLLFKLLLAAQQLFTPGDASTPFAVSEVLAKEQKNPAQQKTKGAPAEPLTSAPEGAQPESATPAVPTTPVDMAAYLDQKDTELKRKQQQLQEREQYLQQMQKDIEKKLEELIAIQKEIQAYRDEKAAGRNANIKSLAQIYGSMKPKEAAKLFENMDEKLVVSVISTMKSEEAAPIFSAMDAKKAAKISEALTKR